MSSYSTTATPAPTGQEVSATAWMYAAILATLAALSMATYAVTQRLAAAVLLLVAGVAVLVFLPLVRRTRRYAEALREAQIELESQQADAAGNLTVLRGAHIDAWPRMEHLVDAPAPVGQDRPEAAPDGEDAGEPGQVPAGHPVDRTWSDTVARITELQRPTRASRRAAAARTGH